MLGRTSGGDPWTPLEIDVKVFLMAKTGADFLEAGGIVSQWIDRSGYGNDQDSPTTLTQPTWTGSELRFSGSEKTQTNPGVTGYITELHGATGLTYAIVFDVDNAIPVQVLYANSNTTNSFNPDLYTTGGDVRASHRPSGGQLAAISNNTYYIDIVDWELAGSSPVRQFLDGVLQGTVTGATDTIGTNFQLSLGARPNNLSNPLTGGIKAVLVFDAKLSDSNREKVEGYLAHEFGLTGSLPLAHPYKSSPPTV